MQQVISPVPSCLSASAQASCIQLQRPVCEPSDSVDQCSFPDTDFGDLCPQVSQAQSTHMQGSAQPHSTQPQTVPTSRLLSGLPAKLWPP